MSDGKAIWNLEVIYNDKRYMAVFHILGSKNQPNRIYSLFDESISDIEVVGNIHEPPKDFRPEHLKRMGVSISKGGEE